MNLVQGSLLAATLALGAQAGDKREEPIAGSGHAKTESRKIGSFTSIQVKGFGRVVAKVGTAKDMTITFDDNLLSHVTTKIEHDTLILSTDHSLSSKTPLVFNISAPVLKAVSISGSGNISVSGVKESGFAAVIKGSGNVDATGHSSTVDVAISGSGRVDVSSVSAQAASVAINGSGSVTVNASKSVNAVISGSGSVRYKGEPKVEKLVHGSGSVTKA